ncbi:MAG: AI-2E family transporter [Clostridia bacterium]
MFELNSKNIKKILVIITYTILLCFACIKFDIVLKALSYILNLLKPFIFGFCIAFILNIPLSKIEGMLTRKNKKGKIKKNSDKREKMVESENKKTNGKLRLLSIVLSLLIFIGIIFLTLFLVIPEFINTISIFKDSIPTAFNTCKEWLENVMSNNPQVIEKINEFKPDWQQLDENVTTWIKSTATGIIGVSIDFVISFFSGVINFFMGVIFAVYMLMQKEKLVYQFKKLFRAYIPEEKCNSLFHIGQITNDTFKKFFGGQFIEAILLGILCFIGMTIFRMPYALTISVLVGVTALIPVFGAFFGTAIGAILILAVDPMQAVWFVVYIIVLQQIDGNFIYPKVVGDSVGLPGIWVMLAVLVGGNSMGIIGMLIGVPIASVIYKLVKEYVNSKKIKE